MKGFFQSLLGSMAAMVMLGFTAFVAFCVFIGVVVSMGEEVVPTVPSESVLVFDLNIVIYDAPPVDTLAEVLAEIAGGQGYAATYLLEVVDSIERAASDTDISALLIYGGLMQSGYGSGLAAISEVREAIEVFKRSGKKVYAYLVDPTQKDYFLASMADEIWSNPFGVVSLNGLALNSPYLGEALDKYGIGVQTTRVGVYKSAVEVFTRSSMSDSDRIQRKSLLDGLWGNILAEIAAARAMSSDELFKLSQTKAFFTAEEAQDAGLVDQVGYLDELIVQLKDSYGESDSGETFVQVDLFDYAKARGFERDVTASNGDRLAVVYAEGEIMDGGYLPGYVGGDWLASELRRLRQDPEVKAVVLRVNSPGGSALASEVVQRETRLLAAEKPLIVSMGSYAASGGYWIAAYADKIFAQPTTITGSIGVFGMVFNFQEAAKKVSVHFDGVKTAPFADIFTPTRPRTEEEMALVQHFTDEIYDAFLSKVAEGRSLELDVVKDIAQGRVWSGFQATEIDLVDELGGLRAAIDEAVSLTDLNSLVIEQVPSSADWSESLVQFLDSPGAAPLARAPGPIEMISAEFEALRRNLAGFNDPRSVYLRIPYGFEGL